MQLCLSHPTHGYYMNASNPVFGSQGDFITSPEITQVFGELIGIWLLSQWANSGCPSDIRLVELGPGRGTLMDDIVRVISQLRPSNIPLNIHLVETSPALRAIQEQKLASSPKRTVKLHFHHSISDVPHNPSQYTMFVAHEFFDALPIHLLQRKETGWHEVTIDTDRDSYSTSSSSQTTAVNSGTRPLLRRVLSPSPTAASTVLGLSSPRFNSLPIGSFIEVSPAAFRIARQVAQLVSGTTEPEPLIQHNHKHDVAPNTDESVGGCGLIIDYGGDQVYGDSFRAFRQHKLVDVFHRPGECDLTANVDFAYLKEAMSDLVTPHGPVSQRTFLDRMGISLRADALARSAPSEERRAAIRDSAKRITDSLGMGEEYKVLGMTSIDKRDGLVGAGVWPFEVKEEKMFENCVHVKGKE
ncbi:hypothetical protein AGABI2DRAFT_65768 [Agaricus bisporus var. bisporus H97]|uniref:hypothetical protein n=1 Tax=Agaricus bisporus var. bisporus (strain H97 / ATCC MYA-4626 / FGSC 10389) TaxID=936046 RepID=UPI00029F7EC8|nr:hypothetical protein AGABI2DRAFT_65768 [Agaricus bisporus var. bisporus H97]EKV49185.1 hypothetical protein AGABI2DRAFT_65768 [Agaricus bisporus var. bisporus H97]